MPVYLDMAATTPVLPNVADVVMTYMMEEYGNPGSRSHEYGNRAKKAVHLARERVGASVGAEPAEVVFTSGATESNNLALLGLAPHGELTGRRHIISCVTEHKAVLEPLQHLSARGFEVELLEPGVSGRLDAGQVLDRVRDDTLLVSLMHVNNETGVIQPVDELAQALVDTPTLLHVDAAQGFGKLPATLTAPIDLMSISGHKIGAPKGIGALIARRRNLRKAPLTPLMYGGGQERKLRPGTLPVALIMGLAEATAYFDKHHDTWAAESAATRRELLAALRPLGAALNGNPDHCAPHILNLSFPGADAEALLLALKELVAISTGSACTSASYTPSHVLAGMGLAPGRIEGAIRLSWWGRPALDVKAMRDSIAGLTSTSLQSI